MSRRIDFTADRVGKLRCEPGKQQTIYQDGKTPGLGLRVTAAGAQSYVFESRLHGKTLRVTIGDPRAWPLGKAQAEARRLKTLVDQGIDPREVDAEKREAAETKRREAKAKEVTVGEAWDAYIAARAPKWGERHTLNHQNLAKAGGEKRKRGRRPGQPELTMAGPLYPLLAHRLADLDADAVRAWLDGEVATRPTWAGQAYRALRAFLAWAADQKEFAGAVHADAYNRRMARDVLPRTKAKADALQREQLKAWFSAVRQIGNPVIAAYLQGLLLTGARRNELATLQWADIDFQWHSLAIRDKVEGERTIPLTPYLELLFSALPRRTDSDGNPVPWVFSSPTAASGRITEPRIAHNKALAVAGIEGLTLHGLRRSFKSLSEWVECPVGIVAQLMGHKPSATAEKHYTVRPLDLLRMWHTKIEAWILEQADVAVPSEKVPRLRRVKSDTAA